MAQKKIGGRCFRALASISEALTGKVAGLICQLSTTLEWLGAEWSFSNHLQRESEIKHFTAGLVILLCSFFVSVKVGQLQGSVQRPSGEEAPNKTCTLSGFGAATGFSAGEQQRNVGLVEERGWSIILTQMSI